MPNNISATVKVIIVTLMLALATASAAWIIYKKYGLANNTVQIPDNFYTAATKAESYATAVKRTAPAVVSIKTNSGTSLPHGLGSGVIISADGFVLTNNHVIENSKDIVVQLADGRSSLAFIVGSDPQTDLAVLQIGLSDLPIGQFGTSATLQVGDIVLAIGNPFGLKTTVTQGIISATGPVEGINDPTDFGALLGDLIQTDAAINLGNSGGALIDTNGLIIGINTALLANITGSQGIGFAIPIDHAKEIISQLISKGTITRGWIGAQLTEIPQETRISLNFADQTGIYVQDTIRNSPAQRAGILPGDIITKIDNVQTYDINATIQRIATLQPENTYKLEVFRQGKTLIYPVTVAVRP